MHIPYCCTLDPVWRGRRDARSRVLDVEGCFSRRELVFPTLPNLRALWLRGLHRSSAECLATCRVPRLHWALLRGFSDLQHVTFDCPELPRLGAPWAPIVRVASRCLCPPIGYGEFDYVHGTLIASN